MVLNGINIRSGLELDVPVKEIFKIEVAPEGNILAKEFYRSENKNKILSDIIPIIEKEEYISYSDLKLPQKINDSLICYVYDSYFLFKNELKNGKIECEKTSDLLFINTELLEFEDFCQNIMDAQSFSGNFEKSEFNHNFIGVGNFDLDEYVPLHPLVANSNINLVNFFIYHKKILSSIGYFICGLFENDIKDQRKYLTDQEYKQMISFAKAHKKNIINSFKNTDGDGLINLI